METKRIPQIGAVLFASPEQGLASAEHCLSAMRGLGMSVCVIPAQEEEFTEKVMDKAADSGLSVRLRISQAFQEADILRFAAHPALSEWELSLDSYKEIGDVLEEIDRLHSLDPSHKVRAVLGDLFQASAYMRFSALKGYADALGADIVPNRDFDFLIQRRYAMAVSAVCDMLRTSGIPFGISGILAGNSLEGFCPKPYQLDQWFWTAVGQGADSIVFSAINSPLRGDNAGQGALLDFRGNYSERALAVKKDKEALDGLPELTMTEPDVTLLYTFESRSESVWGDTGAEGAGANADIKSALAFYDILMECGVKAQLCEAGDYDWSRGDYKGKYIILSGQKIVPVSLQPRIRNFVKAGGCLFVEGLSFFYDETGKAVLSAGTFPLSDLFGGRAEEFFCGPEDFRRKIAGRRLWVHYCYGKAVNEASGESLRILRNKYGRGRTVWIPSMIGLAAVRTGHRRRILAKFLRGEFPELFESRQLVFRRRRSGMTVQFMHCPEGPVTVISNSGAHRRKIRFRTELRVKSLLYSNIRYDRKAKARGRKIKLRSQHTAVTLWNKENV